jgi:phasin family protein
MARTTHEQPDMLRAGTNAYLRMSEIAFSGFERLVSLNLDLTRQLMKEGVAAPASFARMKDIQDPKDLPSPFSGHATEQVVAYFRDVQEITTDMQQDMLKLMTSEFTTLGKGSAGTMPAFDLFNRMALQATDMAQANFKTVAETTEKMASSVHHAKKSA